MQDKCHRHRILALAISSDGRFLVSAYYETSVFALNVLICEIKSYSFVFTLQVSGDEGNLIHVWNSDSLQHIHVFKGHKGPVTGLAFRRDAHQLFSVSSDRSVKVWSLDEMACIETL